MENNNQNYNIINVIRDKYSACVSVSNNLDIYYALEIKPKRRLKFIRYILPKL